MPTTDTTTSKASQRSKPSSFDVKDALIQLKGSGAKWSKADASANGYLYSLLGEIYVAMHRIEGDKSAEKTLRTLCAKSGIKGTQVAAMLISHTIGTDKNDAKLSQWKNVLGKAKDAKVPKTKEAFSKWLEKSGGIEGVITKGKNNAINMATTPTENLDAKLKTIGVMFKDSRVPLPVDLTSVKSFSDTSFIGDYALLLVQKVEDPDTATASYSILSLVNDKGLLEQAASKLKEENGAVH